MDPANKASLQAVAPIDLGGVRGKPFLIAHGTRDRMIPVKWAQAARDTLTAAGAAVQYVELPMDHHVSDRSLAAIDGWLRTKIDRTEAT